MDQRLDPLNSTKPLLPALSGYVLWNSLRTVTRETACDAPAENIDLSACRTIHELAESIERGTTTPAEQVAKAVGKIFANYPRAVFANLGTATDNACELMMRRAPGLVAMLADPELGIAGRESYPPTLKQLAEAADKAERSVLLAASGARRALGLRTSFLDGNR